MNPGPLALPECTALYAIADRADPSLGMSIYRKSPTADL